MEPMPSDALISSRDAACRARFGELVKRSGWTCAELREPGTAMAAVPASAVLLLDYRDGLGGLEDAARKFHWVIALGPRGDAAAIVESVRAGARDYLPVDASLTEVGEALARAGAEAEAIPGGAVIEAQDRSGPRRVTLVKRLTTIGRDPSCDVIFEDAAVSRQHARIARSGDAYEISDAGSRHGLFVNGQRVDRRRLDHGDEVRLGAEGAPSFRFVLPAPEVGVDDSFPPTMDGARPLAPADQEMRDIASLLDTFMTLNSDLVLDDLLAIVISRSMELAGAERGMILLADDAQSAGGSLHVAMARHSDGTELDGADLEISRKIPETVMTTGRGVILQDLLVPEEAMAHPSTIQIGVRSAMCVPLKGQRRADGAPSPPLGVLYVDSTSATQPFSSMRLGALESLAAEASKAISNARLYQLSLEKRRIDEEMRIARVIQKSLLPPASHESSWASLHGTSEPSLQVGGDLLVWWPFGEDRLALGVGDVSGKGIPAAIMSSMLDGLCHGLASRASRTPDLGRLAGEINSFLLGRAGTEKFVSLFFGLLDRTGLFSYVNAGHNPPLRVTVRGEVELLRSGGLVLGALEEAAYEAREVRLAAGDILVLYSDGVTEAKAPDRRLFGLERLRDAAVEARSLPPREVHARVLSAVSAFTRGALQADDITLMVVTYAGPAAGRGPDRRVSGPPSATG